MADELFDLLEKRSVERSKCVKPNADNIVEFSFLEQIITPVYQVVAAEAQSSGNGIAPHGAWRNYDDFNEFFWSGLWTLPIVTCTQFSTEIFLCQEFPMKLDK
jgi:callose synthase